MGDTPRRSEGEGGRRGEGGRGEGEYSHCKAILFVGS